MKKSFNYDKLTKIKRPILLVVKYLPNSDCDRYRIVFPDGSVIYNFINSLKTSKPEYRSFGYSCFNIKRNINTLKVKPIFSSLKKSIKNMKEFDEMSHLKVVEMIRL